MTKIAIIFLAWVFLLLASGGGLTRADYNPIPTSTDTYECYNYAMVSDQMFQLQSDLIYAKGFRNKARIKKQINKLRPLVINREVLCLGYGVTPN